MKIQIVVIILGLIVFYGYGRNILELTRTDFKEPYKAEAIRALGVVVPPVGVIAGFVEIDDTNE